MYNVSKNVNIELRRTSLAKSKAALIVPKANRLSRVRCCNPFPFYFSMEYRKYQSYKKYIFFQLALWILFGNKGKTGIVIFNLIYYR
ncbi:hypothetical protein DLM78_10355 [Leptospira stimsonii]|uniref:Uncharacterized protein n=1 Tax=Leptospira stimsonii TaxID=2202203 RepID=A0A8B3CTA2_9LEPT|nr:hypothetical protein DLM78_10355 [Leptospira stimsonii]